MSTTACATLRHAHVLQLLHALQIILQTAKFVRQAGGQTEFVLRVKQAANPNFNFLEPSDLQHPYFRWLVSTKPEVQLCRLPVFAVLHQHKRMLTFDVCCRTC